MRGLAVLLGVVLSVSSARAGTTVFENDPGGWATAAGPSVLIDFEIPRIRDGSFVVPSGTEYAALPGSPTFIPNPAIDPDFNSTLAIINPGTGLYGADFFPTSGANMFAPDADRGQTAPRGIVTITFSLAVNAFSAWFLDVEGGFATTGLDLDGDGVLDVAFGAPQGDNSQAFLGVVSNIPFTSIDIYFAAGTSEGVGLDDIRYVLAPTAPEPSTLVLLALAAAAVARPRKRAA